MLPFRFIESGWGLLEEIYQESLGLEFQLRGIPYKAKQELAAFYKGRELKKRHIADRFVHEHIVVELKSVSVLAPEHEAELINYMRIMRQPVRYLINFGPIGNVEWKRFVLSEFVNVKVLASISVNERFRTRILIRVPPSYRWLIAVAGYTRDKTFGSQEEIQRL